MVMVCRDPFRFLFSLQSGAATTNAATAAAYDTAVYCCYRHCHCTIAAVAVAILFYYTWLLISLSVRRRRSSLMIHDTNPNPAEDQKAIFLGYKCGTWRVRHRKGARGKAQNHYNIPAN
jgi:hypothetical protein